jgi:hypothetical protein
MNLFKNIVLLFLSVQEKILLKKINKPLSKKQKKQFANGCYLSFDSITETQQSQMEDELGLIIKSCNYKPTEILDYIKKHNTKIHNLPAFLLKIINLNTGFIYPQKGLSALYIGLITQKEIKFKTDAMFIINKNKIDDYLFMYHLYNWYTYRHGIQGIDADSQRLLNLLLGSSDDKLKKLSLNEMSKLKDAIKQDKNAIDFVLKLYTKLEDAKKLKG